MDIPLNGRIAIVDDKYEEVRPLANYFAKNRIPFNYYSGDNSELPISSDTNPITLLFLDLNIVESQHSPRVVISTLHPILKVLCPGNSKPYLLIIWSKKIDDFANELENHFKISRDLKNKQPIKIVRLAKSDYFDLVDGKYLFDSNKYNDLIQELSDSLASMNLLRNFLNWENVVHQEAMQTTNEFSSLYAIDNEWNLNTKAVIYHLAKAVIGPEEIGTADHQRRLLTGFGAINSFLADRIQSTVQSRRLGDADGITDDTISNKNKEGRLKQKVRAKINTKLHLVTTPSELQSFEQGNVFKVNGINLVKLILFKEKYPDGTKGQDIIDSKPNLLYIDLTPVCDYAQNKSYTRFLHGLLIDAKFSNINIKSAYQQQSPCFDIDGAEKFILFDYRFVKTMTRQEITKGKKKPIFRLRREICIDLQSQLSNQVNRPGINNV